MVVKIVVRDVVDHGDIVEIHCNVHIANEKIPSNVVVTMGKQFYENVDEEILLDAIKRRVMTKMLRAYSHIGKLSGDKIRRAVGKVIYVK